MPVLSLVRRATDTRLVKALVVALAVQLALTTLTGLAAAPTTTSDDLPARFSVPEVRVGDVAIYDVQAPDGGEPPSLHGRSIDEVGLEWKQPAWTYTRSGAAEPVARMKLYIDLADPPRDPGSAGSDPGSEVQGQSFDTRVKVHYNLTTWRSEATTHYTTGEMTTHYVNAVDEGAATSKVYDVFHTQLSDPRTPCGFHLPFHGDAVNATRPLDRAGDCPGPNGTLIPTSIVSAAGTRALHLASATGSPVTVAYAPDLPVPVAWQGPLSALGLKGETNVSLELSDYGRGDGKAASLPDEPRPAPFTVPVAEAEAWGPPEANLADVAFPLSEAYRVLLEESQAADTFLDEHPDAYTARAWMFKDRDEANRPQTNWQIVLTDGTDTLERFVSRSDPVEAPTADLEADPPERVWTREDRSVPHTIPEPADRYPSPDLTPDQLPVVGTRDFPGEATGGYAPWETPNPGHYGVSITCREDPCSQARSIVEIGAKPPDGDGPAPSALPWEQSVSGMAVGLDARGDLVYMEGKSERWTGDELEAQDARGPRGPAEDTDTGPWTIPAAEAAAGAGIVAILSGALYYLWPKLKLVGLGLYSRIGDDPEDVLDSATRREIHEIIREEPGIHFSELRRRLETGRGVLDHHLDRLTAAGLVVERSSDAYVCYFPVGEVPREIQAHAGRLRSDSARSLAIQLLETPAVSVTELADAVGISRSTASYHVDKLADADLVDRTREGQARSVELTELGRRAVEALGLS